MANAKGRAAKTILILGIILFTVSLALFVRDGFTKEDVTAGNEPSYVVSHGKHLEYKNFQELDNDTEIVIQGRRIGNVKTILEKNAEGQVIDNRTLSGFAVEKVQKIGAEAKIKKGDTIVIQENAAAEGKTVYSTVGYQLMNTNEEYLLFLRESLTEPGVYIIKGVYFGKVPLTDTGSVQFKGELEKLPKLKEIYNEARAKYK